MWAHPDDETYLAGGILALAADAGRSPIVLTATTGERGFADPVEWPPERAAAVRACEARAAMAVLGVTEHWWLGYEDGLCAEADAEAAAVRIAAIIDHQRPDTVLTFGPDGVTGHPDHCAVSAWVTRAVEIARHRPRLLHACAERGQHERFAHLEAELGTMMDGDGPPVLDERELAAVLRLDGRLLDRKVAALRSMATQTAGIVSYLGERTYAEWVSVEAFVEVGAEPSAVASCLACTTRSSTTSTTPSRPSR